MPAWPTSAGTAGPIRFSRRRRETFANILRWPAVLTRPRRSLMRAKTRRAINSRNCSAINVGRQRAAQQIEGLLRRDELERLAVERIEAFFHDRFVLVGQSDKNRADRFRFTAAARTGNARDRQGIIRPLPLP